MDKLRLYARESVAFDKTLLLKDTDGSVLDITGWTFVLDLFRFADQSAEIQLAMAPSAGAQGFELVDAANGALQIVIDQATLAGIADTTGNFTMFGDLLGTPSGGAQQLITDVRLNVTTAGQDFHGDTIEVTLTAIGGSLQTSLEAIKTETEAARDTAVSAVDAATKGAGDESGAAFFERDSDGDFIAGTRSDGFHLRSNDSDRPVYFVSPVNGVEQVHIRTTRGSVSQLTCEGRNWAVEPLNGGLISFLTDRNGFPEAFTMNASGGEQQPMLASTSRLDLIRGGGQSIAVSNTNGQLASPTFSDARAVMLGLSGANNGPRVYLDSSRAAINDSQQLIPGEITGIVQLTEVQSPSQSQYGETFASGMAAQLLAGVDDPDIQIGFTINGEGGRDLDDLGPGTENWSNTHRSKIAWHLLSSRQIRERASVLIHDHAHILANFTREQQRDALLERVADELELAVCKTAGEQAHPILTWQSGNATYQASTNEECRRVWHGTLDAVRQSPQLHLVGPGYFLETYDGVHGVPLSPRLMGEYMGKVLLYIERGNWRHTGFDHAKPVERNGTSLFVPCQSYTGTLKENYDPVVARPNLGFNFEDGVANGVELVGNPTIDNTAGGLIFTLDGTPQNGALYSGSSATSATTVGQDPTEATSAGVNISDTDTTLGALSGLALPNWFASDYREGIS